MRSGLLHAAGVAACFALLAAGTTRSEDPVGAPPTDRPPSHSPEEAAELFAVPDDLAISLVVAEPEVSQPLSISFDDRGRMWILQYLQYPNPEGLKPVDVDNWLRTKYDQVPPPPPHGPQGKDRISIYEDADGDGRPETVKQFVSDLNLASGMALGYDGVFVIQPPYLLFYPDRDRDDVPDSAPEVLLTGFGMEDAHAFANSLTWGPDGWLYGAQGSTATADIRGIGFQQGVWRYHPVTKEFELFAEGGGNTWGIDFDRHGNLFAAGNTVEPLVHHVQGAYYVKGFGKHGPLHNPHAYGYFQPVQHLGYVGDSLTGGFVLYQGGAFPERFNDACIAPNTRHSASRWSTLESRGSTFVTRAAGDFITTSDTWFRPIESTVGPDGALYVADWYDYNISHSNPQNRSQWYQPSRFDGRVWRVAPKDVERVRAGAFDLSARRSDQLVELLSHPNDWYARQARRILAERRDRSVAPALRELALGSDDQRLALQGLWSLYVIGAFDDELAAQTLDSRHEYVRAWSVRLLGDANRAPPSLQPKLVQLAREDPSVIVRSQLACTAKRLPGSQALPILSELLRRSEDVNDVHIPLLIWWAIEDKAISDRELVLRLAEPSETWRLPLVHQFVAERLARRYAAEGTEEGFAACARLMELAPSDADVQLLVAGVVEAFSGRSLKKVPVPLRAAVHDLLRKRGSDARIIEFALRLGSQDAYDPALALVGDESRDAAERISLIKALGEIRAARATDDLLALLDAPQPDSIHSAVISSLGFFDEQRIAGQLLEAFAGLGSESRSRAIELLCSRRDWSLRLLTAVAEKKMEPGVVSVSQLRQMLEHDDERISHLITAHWGRVQPATTLESEGRITALLQKLATAPGDAEKGAAIFEKSCATCHKLHGRGNAVGPDLTGAERKDQEKLLRNIVDPSSVIRQEFISHVAVTVDGRIVTGLLADATPETVAIVDAANKRTVLNRNELEELRESPISLMPEGLLDSLTDQQIRDLIAYTQSEEAQRVATQNE